MFLSRLLLFLKKSSFLFSIGRAVTTKHSQRDEDTKVDERVLYDAINYNAWGFAPFPLNHQVAQLLYQTLISQRFVQLGGKWLQQLRQDDDNAELLSSKVDRRKSTYRRRRRVGLDAARKGI